MPKKDGGLRLILDLCHLNLLLRVSKFKILTLKSILSHIRTGDWFVTIDLKDAYFRIQIVKICRKFLRFGFEVRTGSGSSSAHEMYGRGSGPVTWTIG